MKLYELGDVVQIAQRHPSILAGMGAVVLRDDGDSVWLVTPPIGHSSGGPDFPPRHVIEREFVVEWSK